MSNEALKDLAIALERVIIFAGKDPANLTAEQRQRWLEADAASERILERSYILTGERSSIEEALAALLQNAA